MREFPAPGFGRAVLRGDSRDFRAEFTRTLDAFASKMETLWRESASFPAP
ncbi:MAG: hypothetical protein HY079_06190 [Elusimicrobia bacterium]|nr:hypothetical protein [Elusimicrobiota bacterium]